MMAGIEDAMVLAQELCPGMSRDLTELVVGVGDHTGGIGDGHDGMFVERGPHIPQLTTGRSHVQITLNGPVGLRNGSQCG